MEPTFNDDCTILYTVTDSLIYENRKRDSYEVMRRDYFDTSDYPKDNVYGMMKDHNNGRIMTDFIGRRTKMFTVKLCNYKLTKRIKGVKKFVVITFEDYLESLEKCTKKPSLDI